MDTAGSKTADDNDVGERGGERRSPIIVRFPLVLVVDDDPGIRDSIAEALRDERFIVATASDGEHALSMLREGLRPAAILLDLWMPNVSGAEALELIRFDPTLRDLPVIIISAFADGAPRAVLSRADAVLQKPIDLDRLLAAVERFVIRVPH